MPTSNTPVSSQPIWERLDYAKNAVIEASAGTGKTYTLEHIVVELVARGTATIDKILLVTFTEKAAGELRDRIRKAIADAAEPSSADGSAQDAAGEERRQRLREAADAFDSASISTIHGFCQRILREFAFENNVPMEANIASDGRALARQAVREVLTSKDFAENWGEEIQEVLKKGADGIVDELSKRVDEYRNERWDQIPDLADLSSPPPSLDACITEIKDCHSAFRREYGSPPSEIFAKEMKEYGYNATSGKALQRLFERMDKACKDHCPPRQIVSGLIDFASDFIKKTDGDPVAYLNKSYNAKSKGAAEGRVFTDAYPKFVQFAQDLLDCEKKLAELEKTPLSALFSKALERYRRMKEESSMITYDDMILGVDRALEEGDALRDRLRERFRIALVDEFQDTDGVQWDIFNRVFNNPGGDPPNTLVVVGDPKQAIYAFRGADINTYNLAKEELGKDGQVEGISQTYRSSREMLDAFNTMFVADGWFATPDARAEGTDAIAYGGVNYPEGNVKFEPAEGMRLRDGSGKGLPDDRSEMGPVVLLESLWEDGVFVDADWSLATFVRSAVKAVRYLMEPQPDGHNRLFVRNGGGAGHDVGYGDFCFLAKSHHDAAVIATVLGKEGIPFSYYKEAGVYDSAESQSVFALLEFLANPQRDGLLRAALVTPFFGVSPADVAAHPGLADPVFAKQVARWRDLAADRKWARLFNSLVDETRIAYSAAGDDGVKFDRRIAAVRQIFGELLTAPGFRPLSLDDFCAKLLEWKHDAASAGEDAECRRKETEEPRVKIMTMHACKGLQFPVVFVAWGWRKVVEERKPPLYIHVRDDSAPTPRYVRRYPLVGKLADGDLETALQEARAEMLRLLYVSLTRAEYKLFLPWTAGAAAQAEGIGTNGAGLRNGGFLYAAIQALFKNAPNVWSPPPPSVLRPAPSPSAQPPAPTPAADAGKAPRLFTTPALYSSCLPWDSFSSLHLGGTRGGEGMRVKSSAEAEEFEARGDDEGQEGGAEEVAPAPAPDFLDEGYRSLVPRGVNSGNVFHEVMEALCNEADSEQTGFQLGRTGFDAVVAETEGGPKSHLLELIRKQMRKNAVRNQEVLSGEDVGVAVADDTAHAFARMVWNALNAGLSFPATGAAPASTVFLKDIVRADRRAELAFAIDEADALDADSPHPDGVFNGSIDLLFRWGGRFYIVDWKTNQIDGDRYGPAEVEAKMDECGYPLQFRLYAVAAARWLGADDLVAGSAYLFVRGGERRVGDEPGIYIEPAESIRQYRELVRGEMEGKGE